MDFRIIFLYIKYLEYTYLLETTLYYKYLGMVFSSSLCLSKAVYTLSIQAKKRCFFNISMCSNLPVKSLFYLFDRTVLPILLYGLEIWGFEIRAQVEKVQLVFL